MDVVSCHRATHIQSGESRTVIHICNKCSFHSERPKTYDVFYCVLRTQLGNTIILIIISFPFDEILDLSPLHTLVQDFFYIECAFVCGVGCVTFNRLLWIQTNGNIEWWIKNNAFFSHTFSAFFGLSCFDELVEATDSSRDVRRWVRENALGKREGTIC